jgi:hypothetical protein
LAGQDRQGVTVTEDEFPVQALCPGVEAEWHAQAGFGPGDWQQRQFADVDLQDHGTVVGHLPLKAYPAAGVQAGVDKLRGQVGWQHVDAPSRGCAPLPGIYRCSCLRDRPGLLFALLLGRQLRFGVVEYVGHLLPVGSRCQEVRVDERAVRDEGVGGVDDGQPHVATHDRKPFSRGSRDA